MDQAYMQRALCIANSYEKLGRLLGAAAEECEHLAHLIREMVRLQAAAESGAAEGPAWGQLERLRFGPGRASGGQTVFIDDVPVDLTRLEAAALRALESPGGERGADDFEYKAPSLVAKLVAERLRRPPQTSAAVSALLSRLRGKFRRARSDGKELIVFCRSVRGYRLALAQPSSPPAGSARRPH